MFPRLVTLIVLKQTLGDVRIHRSLWPKRIVKDPGREGFTLSLSQQFHCAGRQDDFPCSRIGFGIPRHKPATLFPMEGAADFQGAATLIYNVPNSVDRLLKKRQPSGTLRETPFCRQPGAEAKSKPLFCGQV